MKTTSRHAMAMVTSLIMLGLVAMLAIAFIGMARRERVSVTVTQQTTEAKLMADTSLARAQAEIMRQIKEDKNLQLMISTLNPATAANPLPSAPVVYTVNGQPDSRPFLNLNRDVKDGFLFGNTLQLPPQLSNPAPGANYLVEVMIGPNPNDPFGPIPSRFLPFMGASVSVFNVVGPPNKATGSIYQVYPDGSRSRLADFDGQWGRGDLTALQQQPRSIMGSLMGDPQWIGELEDPTQSPSADNRFIGRYAYMIVPASKALGLDWMNSTHHMAAMLHQLDPSPTKANWGYSYYYPGSLIDRGSPSTTPVYDWRTPSTTPARFGTAFDDAAFWLANRTSGANRFFEFTADVFSTGKTGPNFPARLMNATGADPYAFYKLAASLSPDGLWASPDGGFADKCLLPVPPYLTNKFNLNNPTLTRDQYFQAVADRLLAASTLPVLNAGSVMYSVGTLNAGPLLSSPPSCSKIMVYPEYQYTAEVHRLLQLAANITDSAMNTGSYYPLVFRPWLYAAGGQVYIGGFVEQPDASFLTNPTVNIPSGIASLTPNSLAGIIQHNTGVSSLPLLIASKRQWPRPDPSLNLVDPPYFPGRLPSTHIFPNLNELALQTIGSTVTNAASSYTLNIGANVFAETFNSTGYPGYPYYLIDSTTGNPVLTSFTLRFDSALSGVATFVGGTPVRPPIPFASAKGTNFGFQFSTNFFYSSGAQHPPMVSITNSVPPASATLDMTNWVRYALVRNHRGINKVVDYASIVQRHSPTVTFPRFGVSLGEESIQVDDPFVNNLPEEWVPGQSRTTLVGAGSPIPPPLNINQPTPDQPRSAPAYSDLNYSSYFPSGLNSVGDLGRIHRGTPWQTVYFKAWPDRNLPWAKPQRLPDTHPTNDWRLPDLFTTAGSMAAVTGLLSVNNTSEPAWAAVLSGIRMRTHPEDFMTPGTRDYVAFNLAPPSGPSTYRWNYGGYNQPPNGNYVQIFRRDSASGAITSYTAPNGCTSVMTPGGAALTYTNPDYHDYNPVTMTWTRSATDFVVTGTPINGVDLVALLARGINSQRDALMGAGKPFVLTGQLLATPELTIGFPFNWNWGSDADYESIPRQLLPMLRVEDEPRYIVYAWGQSLKPADKSVVTSGPNVGMVNNYVVTGQVGTRTVLRVKNGTHYPMNTNQPPRMVVESFKVLP